MRRVLLSLCVLLALLASAKAYGDTIYDLRGTLQDGVGTFNGTLRYLSAYRDIGQITGTITDGAYSFTVPSNYLGETVDNGSVTYVDVFSVGGTYDLDVVLPNSILTSNAGGSLCALSTPCTGSGPSSFREYTRSGTDIFAQQSFLTLTATPQVTPEPGTFVLLGTGMLGIAGTVRRRVRCRTRARVNS